MKLLFLTKRIVILSAMLTLFCGLGFAADDLPANSKQVIQPEELARTLQSGEKPVVLYVGPRSFYAQSHIPGAEYIGPVGKADAMGKLRARSASLAKDQSIVVYCGCCPWDHCPNIRPAFSELQKLGFTKVRVLYLATSFGADWVAKGFPAQKGQ